LVERLPSRYCSKASPFSLVLYSKPFSLDIEASWSVYMQALPRKVMISPNAKQFGQMFHLLIFLSFE
jgi:hypothetical protein